MSSAVWSTVQTRPAQRVGDAASAAIVVALLATAILSLQLSPRTPLFPHVPAAMLLAQLVALSVGLPLVVRRCSHAAPTTVLLMALWAILASWAMLSARWSAAPRVSGLRVMAVFLPTLLLMLLVAYDPWPSVTFSRVAKALAAFGTVLATTGLVFAAWGERAARQLGIEARWLTMRHDVLHADAALHLSALTDNPNLLAIWLAITLVMTLVSFLIGEVADYVALPAVVLQAGAVALTRSRGGISAAAIGVTMLLVIATFAPRRKVGRGRLAAAWAVLAAGCATLTAASLRLRGLPRADLNGRGALWEAAWSAGIERLWNGHGFGLAIEAVSQPEGSTLSPHNVYLTLFAEVGLPGLLLFLLIAALAATAGVVRIARRRTSDREWLHLTAALGIFVALLVHQVFETTLTRFGLVHLIWVYLAAFLAAGPRDELPARTRTARTSLAAMPWARRPPRTYR